MWETWVRSLGREVPWRRKWQPSPVLLPRKSHGRRSLVSMGSQRVGHDSDSSRGSSRNPGPFRQAAPSLQGEGRASTKQRPTMLGSDPPTKQPTAGHPQEEKGQALCSWVLLIHQGLEESVTGKDNYAVPVPYISSFTVMLRHCHPLLLSGCAILAFIFTIGLTAMAPVNWHWDKRLLLAVFFLSLVSCFITINCI